MRKISWFFLGLLPTIATAAVAFSCVNTKTHNIPNPKPSPDKISDTPKKKPKVKEQKNDLQSVYETIKSILPKDTLNDIRHKNKHIKNLLIGNLLPKDLIPDLPKDQDTSSNILNGFKGPKFEIDFNDPTNELIKKTIDNLYYKQWYKYYDKSKDDGKQHAFDFPLEDDYIENELDIFPSNEPESSEPWETYEPEHNSPWEWDEGADEVSPNEPEHNEPWISDDEEGLSSPAALATKLIKSVKGESNIIYDMNDNLVPLSNLKSPNKKKNWLMKLKKNLEI
ncbi:hypothetical protein [Mycoplasma sp. 327]